jgi:hypothetical protein
MKSPFTSTLLLALLLANSAQAQPGKRPGQVPHVRPNSMVEKKKLDSLNERKSKNEVAIETTERRKNNSKSGVKLDDLKNPFDTGKVRTPAVNRTGKQRRQQINN